MCVFVCVPIKLFSSKSELTGLNQAYSARTFEIQLHIYSQPCGVGGWGRGRCSVSARCGRLRTLYISAIVMQQRPSVARLDTTLHAQRQVTSAKVLRAKDVEWQDDIFESSRSG